MTEAERLVSTIMEQTCVRCGSDAELLWKDHCRNCVAKLLGDLVLVTGGDMQIATQILEESL